MVKIIRGEQASRDCMPVVGMRTKALVTDEDKLAIQGDIEQIVGGKGRNIFFEDSGLNGTFITVGLIQYKSISVNQINDIIQGISEILSDYGYDSRQERVHSGHPEEIARIQ